MEHRTFKFQNVPNKRLKFSCDRGLMGYLLVWALNIHLCVHYVHYSSGQITRTRMLSHFKSMHISDYGYPFLSHIQAKNDSDGWDSVLVHWSHTYFCDRLGWHQKSCKCLATDNQETGSCVIRWCYKIQWDTMEVYTLWFWREISVFAVELHDIIVW